MDGRGLGGPSGSPPRGAAGSARWLPGYLAGLLGLGLLLSSLYAITGIGLPCPFRALTGWLCPFCGGTRMGAALLRGEFRAAWADNPLLLLAGIGLGAAGIGRACSLLLDRPGFALLPRRLLGRAVPPAGWAIVLVVLVAAFTVGRNLG